MLFVIIETFKLAETLKRFAANDPFEKASSTFAVKMDWRSSPELSPE
jgi:hypothetical protein